MPWLGGTAVSPTLGFDDSLSPHDPLVRSITLAAAPENAIRVHLNTVPFPAQGFPIILHDFDMSTSLEEVEVYVRRWAAEAKVDVKSLHLLRTFRYNYKISAVAFIRNDREARRLVATCRHHPNHIVHRNGGTLRWSHINAYYIVSQSYLPTTLGVLDRYVSKYYGRQFEGQPNKLSGIATDVKRRLGEAGELWKDNTTMLYGLGFVYLPHDQLNGDPIFKNTFVYPIHPRLPLIPFPHVQAVVPIAPVPAALPEVGEEPPPTVNEPIHLNEVDEEADEAEVELLVLIEEAEQGPQILSPEEVDEEGNAPESSTTSLLVSTSSEPKKKSVDEIYQDEFRRLLAMLPPPPN